MSAAMEIVVTAQDKASEVIEGIGETAESTAGWIDDNWGKVTAAAGAAGAASEGFARSQADSNATLARAAIVTGESEDALRESVDAMVDHTFSAHDAAAGMDELIRRGVDTKDGFEAVLPVMDTFADATGKDMVQSIGQIDSALNAFGIPLEEAGDHIDTFTFLATQTTVPIEQFERRLGRIGPELQDMNLGLDDSAAFLTALEEKGMTGREALSEFTRAVENADGDLEAMKEQLGLTDEELAAHQERVQGAAGMTDEFAEANNSTITPLERIQANVENLMFKYGGLAEAAGMAAPVLMALGPAMKGLTLATRGLSTAMGFLAANPIVLVIAAVAALAIGIVMLWRRSERFRNIVTGVFNAVASAGRWMWERVLQPAWDGIQRGFDALGRGAERFRDIFRRVMRAAGRAVDLLTAPYRAGLNLIGRGIETVINGVAGAVNRVPSFDIPSWVPGLGGRSFSLPNVPTVSIPRLAQGGIVRARPGGTLAVIGEGGRDEAVVPLPGGGPSMADVLDELRSIRRLLAEGQVLVADNETLARVKRRGDEIFADRNRRVALT